jgi:rod shape-determining protein MreD
MIQVVAISRLPLLHGKADLILLVIIAWGLQEKARQAWVVAVLGGLIISFITAAPYWSIILPYLTVVWLARHLHSRIWQSPLIAMMLITFIGTIFQHFLMILGLIFEDITINLSDILGSVTLASLMLNMILSLPVFVLIKDIAGSVYPVEIHEQ